MTANNAAPTPQQIQLALRDAKEEAELAEIMHRYVIDEDDRNFFRTYKLTILSVLNGIYPYVDHRQIIGMFRKWNAKIGAKFFAEEETEQNTQEGNER
jgi:hypothetical protein